MLKELPEGAVIDFATHPIPSDEPIIKAKGRRSSIRASCYRPGIRLQSLNLGRKGGRRNDFQTKWVQNNENPIFVMIFETGWARVMEGLPPCSLCSR